MSRLLRRKSAGLQRSAVALGRGAGRVEIEDRSRHGPALSHHPQYSEGTNREGEAMCGMAHQIGFHKMMGRSSGHFALEAGGHKNAFAMAQLRANSRYQWHQTCDWSVFLSTRRSARKQCGASGWPVNAAARTFCGGMTETARLASRWHPRHAAIPKFSAQV